MRYPTEAEILQASAIVVAAPRYCGAFAAAIGTDILIYWPGFAHVEIASGFAMAVLEGWTVAFMFRRFRALPPGTVHWGVLLALQVILMLALPATAMPYLVSTQLGQSVAATLTPGLLWAWTFIVAGIAPLVLAAVGYSDVELTTKQATKQQVAKQAEILSCSKCGRQFKSKQALGGHRRFCKTK